MSEIDIAELRRKLVAAAKAAPPSDRAPYRFEQRVMARLEEGPVPDRWAEWASLLWRAAAPCLAVSLCLSAWAFAAGLGTDEQLAADLEDTVYAALDTTGELP